MVGTVSILNVSAGDTKLTFDPKMPAEVARAAKVIKDMLRRGFVLLIEVGNDDKGPIYRRALDFDEDVAEYIIAGDPAPDLTTEEIIINEQKPASAPKRGRKAKATQTRRIPARSAKAVAVARTAGG